MRSHPLRTALLAGLLGAACATRASVPPSGADSPLSPAHCPAPTARTTLALDEDPPLPGDPQGEWTGLEAPPAAPADPHAHHHHAPSDAGAPEAPAHHHGGDHAH